MRRDKNTAGRKMIAAQLERMSFWLSLVAPTLCTDKSRRHLCFQVVHMSICLGLVGAGTARKFQEFSANKNPGRTLFVENGILYILMGSFKYRDDLMSSLDAEGPGHHQSVWPWLERFLVWFIWFWFTRVTRVLPNPRVHRIWLFPLWKARWISKMFLPSIFSGQLSKGFYCRRVLHPITWLNASEQLCIFQKLESGVWFTFGSLQRCTRQNLL